MMSPRASRPSTAGAAPTALAATAAGEPLAELAWTQWQVGDWDSLAGLDESQLATQPQRGRLALMVCAAHLHRREGDAARRFAALARDWGCSDADVARWLIGAVHNTLGRAAAAAGDTTRAVEHFRSSIASSASPALARLALSVRVATQYAQLGVMPPSHVSDDTVVIPARVAATVAPAAPNVPVTQGAEPVDRTRDESTVLRKAIEAAVRREVSNLMQQVQAHADLHAYLAGGRLLPPLHGWAVSADYARVLLELFETRDYELIVEFGSGASTVLLALALQRAREKGRKGLPTLVAFEHLRKYHRQTLQQLRTVGADGVADVVFAPLQPYVADDGRTYPYYDCEPTLAALAPRLKQTRQRLLVIVDGPPAVTAEQARYPALPVLLAHFPDGPFDFLLDDYKRRDEQAIVQRWQASLEALGFTTQLVEFDLEKKACLLRASKRTTAPER